MFLFFIHQWVVGQDNSEGIDIAILRCNKGPCHINNIFLMLVSSMPFVYFKKLQCRPVEFKSHGPQ